MSAKCTKFVWRAKGLLLCIVENAYLQNSEMKAYYLNHNLKNNKKLRGHH